jgi:hypothetical protein
VSDLAQLLVRGDIAVVERTLPVCRPSLAPDGPLEAGERSPERSRLAAILTSRLLRLSRALGQFFAAGGPLS